MYTYNSRVPLPVCVDLLFLAPVSKCTSKGIWRQGIELKHGNSVHKSLCPIVICPYLCSSDLATAVRILNLAIIWHSPKRPPFCMKLCYFLLNHGVSVLQNMQTLFEAMLIRMCFRLPIRNAL